MNYGTETWTKDFSISGYNGPINLWENTQITIDGASVTVKPTNQSGWYGANEGFISGDGATLAFKNASVTVSGAGYPRLATSYQGGTITFDNTQITLASGAQFWNTCMLQAMAAENSSKTSGKIEFNNSTITGSGEDQGIIFLVGSNKPNELNDGKGGWLTFKGTNKLENLGNKNGDGDIILVLHDSSQSGDPFAIEDGTTTISNSAIALEYGGIFVEDGGTLVIDNTILVPLVIDTDDAAITVRSGGTLKFTNGSIYELSLLEDKTAIRIEEGGTLIVDNSEIRGAASTSSFKGSYIVSDGGDVQFINGGALKNNTINNRSDGASGNCILRTTGGSLTIDGGIISGNSTSNAYTGSADSASGAISATDTAVIIKDAVIENNSDYISGAIWLQRPTSVEITNSTFSGNTTKIRSAYANNLYTEYNGRIIVGTGGALSIHNAAAPVTIEGCTFTDNGKGDITNTRYTTTTYAGGAVFLFNSDVTIANSTFNDNTAAFYGGAIAHVAGSLTLNDGVNFTENRCVYTFTDMPNSTSYNAVYGMGGAVAVEEYVTYNQVDGSVLSCVEMELTINDAVFTNNEANLLGGGVAIGYDVYNMEDAAHREHIQATINKATFNGNKVLKNYLDVAGGGLFISQKGHVYMKNAAILQNSTEGAGGGIADCVVGETYLKFRNGAAIFSNSSDFNNSTDAPSENVKDVYLMGQLSTSTDHELNEKMFNGGTHNWTNKEPVSITYLGLDENGGIIIEAANGSFWGSAPSDTNTDGAQVLFYGNEAHTYDKNSWPNVMNPYKDNMRAITNGGAIGNNGILEIGEDAVSISITKTWDDNNDEYGWRPAPADFLKLLSLMANGNAYDLGTFSEVSETVDDDVVTYTYRVSGDASVTVTLTDEGLGSWAIRIDGLPMTIDGDEVTWTVSETAPENYTAADVEGDEDSGFSITNVVITPTPTETPTDDFEMYRFFDGLPELPKTGFSGVKPQRLSVKPADLTYKPLRLTLEIPTLSVNVDLVQVPLANGEYPIEWLGSSAGLLEGSSLPGQGHAIITAHNHLNTTEAGPFALLQYAKVGDVIFVLNERNEMEHFRVYANEKVAKNDIDSLVRIASQSDRSLTLITCEDESIEGGYANRRIIAAAPAGK